MKKSCLLVALFPLLAACAIGQSEGPPAVLIANVNQQTTQGTRVALYLNGIRQPSLVVPPQKNIITELPAGQNACLIVEQAAFGYRFTVSANRNYAHPYQFALNADGQTVIEFSQGDPRQGATATTSCS